MYKISSIIFLSETDATGVIFYPKLLEKSLWAFESFLLENKTSLKDFFDKEFFMPVVNVQLDFLHPLQLSEKIFIEIHLERIGSTSFTLSYHYYNAENKLTSKAAITHVLVDQKERQKLNIPEALREFLIKNLMSNHRSS